jgi:hypothetical protein
MTHDELLNELNYDPDTGIFTWKVRKQGRRNPAGCLTPSGYVTININYKHYPAHRLAWMYVHGRFPEKQIDHINRNPSDNRIVNLREATDGENAQNKSLPKNNTSGFIGVTWNKLTKKWQAQIVHKGKLYNLGHYDDKIVAAEAYAKKKAELHTFHPSITPADTSVVSMAEKVYTPKFQRVMSPPKSGHKGAISYIKDGEVSFMASIRFRDKTYKVPGYLSAEEASLAAERLKERLESGDITPDDLGTSRHVVIAGVSQLKQGWAYTVGVDRTTLWRRAAANGTTFKDEVIKLLPKTEDGELNVSAFQDRHYSPSPTMKIQPTEPQEKMGFYANAVEQRYQEKDYYYVHVKLDGNHLISLSGFETYTAACEKAREIRKQWKEGEIGIEDLNNMRKGVIDGVRKSVAEWAEFLGVSRGAIYKEARRNKRTPMEEIKARLATKEV